MNILIDGEFMYAICVQNKYTVKLSSNFRAQVRLGKKKFAAGFFVIAAQKS